MLLSLLCYCWLVLLLLLLVLQLAHGSGDRLFSGSYASRGAVSQWGKSRRPSMSSNNFIIVLPVNTLLQRACTCSMLVARDVTASEPAVDI